MLVAVPQRGRPVSVGAVNTVAVKVRLLLIVVQSVDHVVMMLVLLLLVNVSVASDQMLVLVMTMVVVMATVVGRTVVGGTVRQVIVVVVVFVLLEELRADRADRVFAVGFLRVVAAGAQNLLLLDAVSVEEEGKWYFLREVGMQ